MAKTLVGTFDTQVAAEDAMQQLAGIGVGEGHARLLDSSSEAGASSNASDKSWVDKAGAWFGSIFDDSDGTSRQEAHDYTEAIRRGHFVVVADVESDQVDQAVSIMNQLGTVDVTKRAEYWKANGYTGQVDSAAPQFTVTERASELAAYSTEQPATLDVVQEELAIGTRVVQRGGVRIHSYIEERPVEELVKLREERVNVERRPVDRAAGVSDLAFKERSIDVTAMGEEAVVEKRARVVEEVVVGKTVEEREETVHETLRRKDVQVEQIPGARTTGTLPPSVS